MEDVLISWNKKLFQELPDPRVKHWPLLGDPLLVTLLTGVWLWFVLRAGPQYMRTRKPYNLSGLIQVINILQVILNVYNVYEFMMAGWAVGYNLECQSCDFSRSPQAMRMARACYIYLALKLFDMVDTVVYVLRRKDNQISFLHIYHHISTLALAWIVMNYAPGGHGTMVQLLNACVHVIMYSYYFLAALGPQYQKYLWWKKYLTRVQLVQFVLQFTHNVNALRIDCAYPKPIIYIFLPIIILMFILFVNFYVQSYSKRKSAEKKAN